ncbi:hypothetical protein NKH77_43050 [Streptomyces sp. M19]
MRDYAQVKADGVITREIAARALEVYDVDARGLDRLDRAVLTALLKLFGGGPVGLSTLAVAVGRSARRWKRSPSRSWSARACWPVRPGPRRHPAAWSHMGLVPPASPDARAVSRTCSRRDVPRNWSSRNPGAMLGVVP